jgi:hypothetical protein
MRKDDIDGDTINQVASCEICSIITYHAPLHRGVGCDADTIVVMDVKDSI